MYFLVLVTKFTQCRLSPLRRKKWLSLTTVLCELTKNLRPLPPHRAYLNTRGSECGSGYPLTDFRCSLVHFNRARDTETKELASDASRAGSSHNRPILNEVASMTYGPVETSYA